MVEEVQKVKFSITELARKYGKDKIKMGLETKPKKSTGSVYFDYLLNGGFEEDTIVLYWGLSMSGKSSMALRNIAEAQKRGETCAWLRIEKGVNREYMEKIGVDVDKLIIIEKMDYGDEYLDVLLDLVENNIDLIVVDSISALVPRREIEDGMDKQQMGLQAALISKLLRKVNVLNKHSIIIFISQVRMEFGQNYTKAVPSGGKALTHNADYIVEFKLKDKLDEDQKEISSKELKTENKNEVTGANMLMYVEKCRRGIAHKTGEMYFSFKTGQIDELGELRKVSIKLGIMGHKGGWDELPNELFEKYKPIFNSYDVKSQSIRYKDFKEILSNNPEMIEWLKQKVVENYDY